MPVSGRGDRRGALVQHTQKMKAVANLKAVIVTGHQSNRFLGQYLREIDQSTAPLELTVLAYPSHDDTGVVRNVRQPGGIGTR